MSPCPLFKLSCHKQLLSPFVLFYPNLEGLVLEVNILWNVFVEINHWVPGLQFFPTHGCFFSENLAEWLELSDAEITVTSLAPRCFAQSSEYPSRVCMDMEFDLFQADR